MLATMLAESPTKVVLSAVAAALLLVACTPPRPKPEPPRPQVTTTPVVVATTTSKPPPAPATAPDGSEIRQVRSASELLRAIGSNRTIVLEPGEYDLSATRRNGRKHVRFDKVYDGHELVITGVENLTIRGAKGSRPTILARPRYAFVLKFENGNNIALDNLVLGHTPEGGCTGGVVAAHKTNGLTISNSDLFGSGTVGVALDQVQQFSFDQSTIRECTYGIATIANSSDVMFSNSKFIDNREFDLVDVKHTSGVRFVGCHFVNNRSSKGNYFFKTDKQSSLVVKDATFEKNKLSQLTNVSGRLALIGGSSRWARKHLNKPDPQFNENYDVVRYQRWIVTGSQAGIAFWNPVTGSVDKLVKAYISSQLLVRGKHLWAGTYRRVIRFDGLKAKSYLRTQKSRGGTLIEGPGEY